jgi:hypothetical protein
MQSQRNMGLATARGSYANALWAIREAASRRIHAGARVARTNERLLPRTDLKQCHEIIETT